MRGLTQIDPMPSVTGGSFRTSEFHPAHLVLRTPRRNPPMDLPHSFGSRAERAPTRDSFGPCDALRQIGPTVAGEASTTGINLQQPVAGVRFRERNQLFCFAAASRAYSSWFSCGTSAPLLLCLVLPAEARHDTEQQDDSRPRMSCIAIGPAAEPLLEQFGRRKHGI